MSPDLDNGRAAVADRAESAAASLAGRFRAVRAQTEALAGPLSAEDCQVQSMPDASPVKWHLAHTTWFFETFILKPERPGYVVHHPAFNFLFNSYYNAVGDRVPRGSRGLITRPGLDEVFAYRAHVDRAMLDLLGAEGSEPRGSIAALVELGLNHEQQHQELILTDVKHALSLNPLRPAYRDDLGEYPVAKPTPPGWVDHPGGLLRIGLEPGTPGFRFDNEEPRHKVHLEGFSLATRAASSGEYLAFIDDGGYERPEFWLSDGWAASRREGWKAPLYWERVGDAWHVGTLGGFRPLSEAEPAVHLSFYEADAFARWSGARLPTEAEWEVSAADLSPRGPDDFLESGLFHPTPDRGGAGLRGMFGGAWEWTRSPYTPYPGSRPVEGALGEYNAKFMCNQMVLRGGSCATPASHVRATYRNFFPPETRWQFAGVRLAKDL